MGRGKGEFLDSNLCISQSPTNLKGLYELNAIYRRTAH